MSNQDVHSRCTGPQIARPSSSLLLTKAVKCLCNDLIKVTEQEGSADLADND